MRRALILLLCWTFALAAYPEADMVFMVVDLKVSEEFGVKVCELQTGIRSAFNGDRWATKHPDGVIPTNFCNFLKSYPWDIWASRSRFSDIGIKRILGRYRKCHFMTNTDWIFSDAYFQEVAKEGPLSRAEMRGFKGFLIDRQMTPAQAKEFKYKYPGIFLLDACSYPYWRDKLKFTRLFSTSPILEALKPRWGEFKKEYTPTLADEIRDKIPSDRLVIKPRGACMGRGVIILEKEDLDETLQYILGDKEPLKKDSDRGFNHWAVDDMDSFLVEEFFPSDLIIAPDLSPDPYQPTMRIVFLSLFEKGEFRTEFLGGYWSTPTKTIYDEGTLTEKCKCESHPPYYYRVEPELMHRVEDVLRPAVPLLHQAMLEGKGLTP